MTQASWDFQKLCTSSFNTSISPSEHYHFVFQVQLRHAVEFKAATIERRYEPYLRFSQSSGTSFHIGLHQTQM